MLAVLRVHVRSSRCFCWEYSAAVAGNGAASFAELGGVLHARSNNHVVKAPPSSTSEVSMGGINLAATH